MTKDEKNLKVEPFSLTNSFGDETLLSFSSSYLKPEVICGLVEKGMRTSLQAVRRCMAGISTGFPFTISILTLVQRYHDNNWRGKVITSDVERAIRSNYEPCIKNGLIEQFINSLDTRTTLR